MRWTVLILTLCACGGSQSPERGEAFCQSYEQNYLGTCRSQCEADLKPGDTAGISACQTQCTEDLKDDDTFEDSCAERIEKL